MRICRETAVSIAVLFSIIVLSDTKVITQAYSPKLLHQCHHDYLRVRKSQLIFLTTREAACYYFGPVSISVRR